MHTHTTSLKETKRPKREWKISRRSKWESGRWRGITMGYIWGAGGTTGRGREAVKALKKTWWELSFREYWSVYRWGCEEGDEGDQGWSMGFGKKKEHKKNRNRKVSHSHGSTPTLIHMSYLDTLLSNIKSRKFIQVKLFLLIDWQSHHSLTKFVVVLFWRHWTYYMNLISTISA